MLPRTIREVGLVTASSIGAALANIPRTLASTCKNPPSWAGPPLGPTQPSPTPMDHGHQLCQKLLPTKLQQLTHTRGFAQSPENVVYSGPTSTAPKRVTLRTLRSKHAKNEPITMCTAYDYPSAVHMDDAGIDIVLVGDSVAMAVHGHDTTLPITLDEMLVDDAGIDIVLVGDSVAMVVHGHDTTLPITLDEMLVHCRAVARGARRSFLVGDMPFGSYETSSRDAVLSAIKMLKEGGMDAVKLEGGSPARVEAARAIVEAGVAVMGHVGLTPQSISVIGGFRPQAQMADEALAVVKQALALQKAGCFSLVLECVPGPIAAAVTSAVSIPTIGIGAGPGTSGQVLVYHDLLGMMSHPHHAKVTPKFCKQIAESEAKVLASELRALGLDKAATSLEEQVHSDMLARKL
eukprot:gene28055-31156_t